MTGRVPPVERRGIEAKEAGGGRLVFGRLLFGTCKLPPSPIPESGGVVEVPATGLGVRVF